MGILHIDSESYNIKHGRSTAGGGGGGCGTKPSGDGPP
jgi:hypothetical protein